MDDLFYQSLIREYVAAPHYVRRLWLSEQVAATLADPQCRFLLLSGEPGSGKTAFMAGLTHEHPDWLRYFIRRDTQTPLSSGDTRSFLFALGYQLAALHPQIFRPANLQIVVRQRVGGLEATGRVAGITIDDLQVSPFYRLALQVEQEVDFVAGELEGISIRRMVSEKRFLEPDNLQYLALLDPARALLKADKKAQIVVLVDALDELRYHQASENLLNWLTNLPELPANLRFVLASRPEDLLEPFRRRQQAWLREVQIDTTSEKVIADLRTYAHAALQEESLRSALAGETIDAQAFESAAIRKADGNFQYLAALLRALQGAQEAGDQARLQGLLRLERLPPGLGALYAFFLSLIKEAVNRQAFEVELPGAGPFTQTGLLPAWEGLYQPILGVLAVARERLSARQIKDFAGLRTADYWLQSAINLLGQFLDRVDGGYRLYHSTFPEFITSPATQENYPEYYLDAATWHKRIAAWYRGTAPAWPQVSWQSADDYGLLHLSEHLYALQENEVYRRELYGLICKSFYEAKQARFGTPQSFTADLGLAIEAAQAHRMAELPQELRGRLIYAKISSLSTALPVDALCALVWLGRAKQALGTAALIGDVYLQLNAYMAVGGTLLEQGQLEQARGPILQALKIARSLRFSWDIEEWFSHLAGLALPLGEVEQVVSLARMLADYARQSEALVAIATEVVQRGEIPRSCELGSEALKASQGVSSRYSQARLLARVAHVFTLAGQREQAEAAIQQALAAAAELKGEYRSWLVKEIAPVLVELGKRELALQEIEATWALLRQVKSPWVRAQNLMGLAYDLIHLGEMDQAGKAANEAFEIAQAVKEKPERESLLSRAAVTLAWAGLFERAWEAVKGLENKANYFEAFSGILEAMAGLGQVEEARSIALQAENENAVATGLASIALALVRSGQIEDALGTAAEITQEEVGFDTQVSILHTLMEAGQVEVACQAAQQVADRFLEMDPALLAQALGGEGRHGLMALLAHLLARSGDERANRLLEIIPDLSQEALEENVPDLAETGYEIQVPDEGGANPWRQADAIWRSGDALIQAGQMAEASLAAVQALEVARKIPQAYGRVLMSGKALQLLASTGQKERALVELAQVEHDLRRLKTNWDQVFGTLSLARACGQVGGREQVLRLLEGLEPRVKRLSGAAERVKALSKMIEILGSAGELDRALELAGRAEALAPRISYAWEKVSAYGLIARALFSIQQDAFAGRKVDKALQVVDATRDKGQATIAQALLAQTLAEAGQQSRAIALVRLAFERAMSLDPDQEGNKWSALLVAVQVALRAGEQEMAVTMASEMANAIVNSGARVYAQEWFMDSALYCLNMAARSLHDAGLKEQALSTWKMQFSDPARASSLDVLSAIEYARVLLSTEMLGEIDEIVEEVKGW